MLYAPLMFSWESVKYPNIKNQYSLRDMVTAKCLFIMLFHIISLCISSVIFLEEKQIIFGLVAYTLFLTGILTPVTLLFASKHIIRIDIDLEKSYRKYLTHERFTIVLLPFVILIIWGIMGTFFEVFLSLYYYFLFGSGILGFLTTFFWFNRIIHHLNRTLSDNENFPG
jgi:hypothetical protein